MSVRHGVGRPYNTRQSGDVGDLLIDLVIYVADQVLVGVDDRGNVHAGDGRDAPFEVGNALQFREVHLIWSPQASLGRALDIDDALS